MKTSDFTDLNQSDIDWSGSLIIDAQIVRTVEISIVRFPQISVHVSNFGGFDVHMRRENSWIFDVRDINLLTELWQNPPASIGDLREMLYNFGISLPLSDAELADRVAASGFEK